MKYLYVVNTSGQVVKVQVIGQLHSKLTVQREDGSTFVTTFSSGWRASEEEAWKATLFHAEEFVREMQQDLADAKHNLQIALDKQARLVGLYEESLK